VIGDLGDGRLTWASPIGWGQEMQPCGANRWWPLAMSAEARELHSRIKRTLDPEGILNPGKFVTV
jgi:putative exporter of polyketide antibiotics